MELEAPFVDHDLIASIKASHGADLDKALETRGKLELQDAIGAVKDAVVTQYAGTPDADDYAAKAAGAKKAFAALEKQVIRERIAVQKQRPDGRGTTEIRPITIEVGVGPRTHGSALFTRGETQAFSVAALGTLKEEMRIDTLGLQTQKFYWHHYNFPPFSVGEAGRMGGPKRRDIGHGALAERALVPSSRAPRSSLHDPRRLRHLRVERLVVDGVGLRLVALADGCRCADQGARRRYRHGPDQGGR